jgi:hypothetical protein
VVRVRRCDGMGFRAQRWWLFTVAAGLWSLRTPTVSSAGETDTLNVVDLCSDDSADVAATFLQGTSSVFAESRIRLRFHCAGLPATGERFIVASFVDDEGIALQLVSPIDERRVRTIPWLVDVHRPLARTLALGKATALGLILEALTADLRAVRFRPLPAPPGPAPGPVPTLAPAPATAAAGMSPAEPGTSSAMPSAVPQPEAPSTALAVPALQRPSPVASGTRLPEPRDRASDHGLEIAVPLLGIAWMPPDTVAPEIEVGLGWGGPRWWAIVDGVLQLDSNFAIEGRTFRTEGYGIRVGIRRGLARSQRFRWDVDLTATGQLSRYRRDDLPGAATHQWADLGAAVHSRVSLGLSRHVVALLAIGAGVNPTARLASIPGGPSRRVNLATVDVVGGLGFAF